MLHHLCLNRLLSTRLVVKPLYPTDQELEEPIIFKIDKMPILYEPDA